ncbi:nitrate reductase, partial [Thermodesulfobacteriota bacterium]
MELYELATGPLVWIALMVFALGSLGRILLLLIQGKQEKILYPKTSIGGGIRSILHGLVPFASRYMRKQPFLTAVTFIFHLCVIVLPIFLLAHTILWCESWNIFWWTLPDRLADLMTILVVMSCIFFFVRR